MAPINGSSYALNFTQGNNITAPDSQSLSITKNITVEAWIKLRSRTGIMDPVVSKWMDIGQNNNKRGYLLYVQSDGKAVFEKSYNGGYEAASGKAVGTTILQLGTWYHLAGTFNTSSREIRIYVNDILEDITNSSYASINDNTEPLTIGSATATGQQLQYFNGIIDEVRILNTVQGIGSIEVTKINPVQVVENVDIVQNKTTIVRATVKSNRNEKNNITVKIFLNGTFYNSTKSNISAFQTKDVDVYIIPSISAQNLPLKAEVEANFSGGNNKSSMTILKNVTRTRDFKVAFVRVGNPLPPDFIQTVNMSKEFIQKTYPLRDNGITTYEGPNVITDENLTESDLPGILIDIHVSGLLTGQWPERTVGIVRSGWFDDVQFMPQGVKGWSLFGFFPAVLMQENLRSTAAHELGHTYFLCDEYSSSEWTWQNNILTFLGSECSNGDRNDDEQLDLECRDSFKGCDTSTFKALIPWNLTEGYNESQLFNFMGDTGAPDLRWIANDSYNHLLKEFSHFSPVNSSSRVIVSGTFNKSSGKAQFRNFYVIGEGLADNESEIKNGNFSIIIFDNASSLLTNISFNMSFTGVFDNGNTTELNVSPFVFILPFSEAMQRFTIQENETIADERNRTVHTPTITLLSPSGGEFFSNQKFNISWIANDADSDNLSYAILYSPDNGSTYNTIALDISLTIYEADSLNLLNCNACRIKVLVTDGVNTNASVSNPFTIKNKMNITELKIVYQNNRERVFRFGVENPTIFTIDKIWWKLNTGQTDITSQINITLLPGRSVSSHVFYNYTNSGNYTVNLTVYSNELNTSKNIQIEVI